MPDPAAISEVADILERRGLVAVLGAHHEAFRPAFYVPDDLWRAGWRVIPVNPRLVGRELWGEPVRATLVDVGEAVDVVDVFRRSEDLAGHIDEILGMTPRPAVVWFQQGIRDDRVAGALRAAGIRVVQDRCMLADRHRLA